MFFAVGLLLIEQVYRQLLKEKKRSKGAIKPLCNLLLLTHSGWAFLFQHVLFSSGPVRTGTSRTGHGLHPKQHVCLSSRVNFQLCCSELNWWNWTELSCALALTYGSSLLWALSCSEDTTQHFCKHFFSQKQPCWSFMFGALGHLQTTNSDSDSGYSCMFNLLYLFIIFYESFI